MNIAVNTRLLLKDKMEGIGWFTYETLKRITLNHPEHRFIFIFDRKFDEDFIFSDNITPVIAHPQARHPILWYLFFEYGVTRAIRKAKADLFLSPDGWLSLKTEVKSLPVIHDINFLHHPEYIDPGVLNYYKKYFPQFASKAQRIATVSEFSKNDISSYFNIDPKKIDVVYNGVNDKFKPLEEEEIARIRLKYSDGKPYFLHVGLLIPRKNIANLVRAFDLFKRNHNSDYKLVLAGSAKYADEEIKMALKNAEFIHDIVLPGRMANDEMNSIIGAAYAMVYPSRFEGFGIPILEAMKCHIPVITSNTTAIPEVGGDSVYYINHDSIESIKEAMQNLSANHTLRDKLIEKGKQQCQKFSWDKTARFLWDSIEKCL